MTPESPSREFSSVSDFKSFYEDRVHEGSWGSGAIGLFVEGTVTLWFGPNEEVQVQDGGRAIYPGDLNFVLRLEARGRIREPDEWWRVVGRDVIKIRGLLLIVLAVASSASLIHWSPGAVSGSFVALTGGLALLLSAVALLAANIITDAPGWNPGVIGNAIYYRYIDHDRAILRMIGIALIACLVGLAIPTDVVGPRILADLARMAASAIAQWTVLWLVFDVLPYYNTRNMTLVTALNRTAYRNLIFSDSHAEPPDDHGNA